MTDTSQTGGRERMRRWLENWERAAPVLESERIGRLSRMTDEEARELTRELLALWRPSHRDEMGEEQVIHQRWFMAAARAGGRR